MTTEPAEPRLLPPPPSEWDDEVIRALEFGRAALLSEELQAALDSRLPERLAGSLPNAVKVMLHNPGLAGGWLAYNGQLLRYPALGARQRELVILRVAWRTRSRYEWSQHVRISPRYGVSADEVEAIATEDGPQDHAWGGIEAALLRAVDQLLTRYTVDDSTWAVLRNGLDDRQLLELPFIVGSYALLGMAFNAFRLPLDPQYEAASAPPIPSPITKD